MIFGLSHCNAGILMRFPLVQFWLRFGVFIRSIVALGAARRWLALASAIALRLLQRLHPRCLLLELEDLIVGEAAALHQRGWWRLVGGSG